MTHLYTFKKHEKLKSRKLIDRLFSEGKKKFSHPLKLVYLIEPKPLNIDDWPLLFSVSVSKKKFKSAAKRNLIKRRIREAYRLNKAELQKKIQEKNTISLSLMFIYIEKEAYSFDQIEPSVKKILKHLLNEIDR